MKDKLFALYDNEGVDNALHYLFDNVSDVESYQFYNELMRHAYWKGNNVEHAVTIAQTGISFGVDKASQHSGEEKLSYLYKVKALHYNLASFVWPGWNEPFAQNIPDEFIDLGRQSADINLDMAIELDRGALAINRAYWMVAAYHLEARKFQSAIKNFTHAIEWDDKTEEKENILLYQGYIHVSEVLLDSSDKNAKENLEKTKQLLSKHQYGEFFIKQLDSSLEVFQPKSNNNTY